MRTDPWLDRDRIRRHHDIMLYVYVYILYTAPPLCRICIQRYTLSRRASGMYQRINICIVTRNTHLCTYRWKQYTRTMRCYYKYICTFLYVKHVTRGWDERTAWKQKNKTCKHAVPICTSTNYVTVYSLSPPPRPGCIRDAPPWDWRKRRLLYTQ